MLFWLLILGPLIATAQERKLRYRDKSFQFSLFPGIGTNGLESGHYFNDVSINLTSNVSAGSYYLDLSLISSMSLRSVSGLQISGLANIVGGNAYVNLTRWEEREIRRGKEAPKLQGIQVSGFMNFVRTNAVGIQVTGGFNINEAYTQAFQLSGLGNEVGHSFDGLQIGGLFNRVNRTTTGIQVSLGFNQTRWELKGIQLGMINTVKKSSGGVRKSGVPGKGVQIGLINRAKTMDGFQLGLINFGGRAQGTRIGLINKYKVGPFKGAVVENYGIPIALFNIGSKGSHTRIYSDDLFLSSIEYTTGNCLNCSFTQSSMPLDGRFMIMNQNALILAYNPTDVYGTDRRIGIGYGFERLHYNKASMIPTDRRNKRYFLAAGLRVMHLSTTRKLQKDLSLLGRLHTEVGMRFLGFYLFGGISINGHVSHDQPLETHFKWLNGPIGKSTYQVWPGYSVGIQL